MEIKISDAKVEDVEGIQDVFYRTWLDTYPNKEFGITVEDIEDRFQGKLHEDRLEKRRVQINARVDNKRFLVAKEGEKVIGLCRITRDSEENTLNAIYVLPEYQGKGAGIALWAEALKFFDSTKDIVVAVATYNQKAIGFYKRLGFVDTGRRFTEERMRMKSGAILPEMEMRISAH